MIEKVLIVMEHHCYEYYGRVSLWVLPDSEGIDDDPREFAEMPEAVRLVGPTSAAECLALKSRLAECFGKLGHEVRTYITADD